MMHMQVAVRRLLLLTTVACVHPIPLEAQEGSSASDTVSIPDFYLEGIEAYLESRGQLGEAQRIRLLMETVYFGPGKTIPASSDSRMRTNAAALVLDGYTHDLIASLKQDGLDILELMRTNPFGLSFAERAALSGAAVVATVVDRYNSKVPGDGRLSSVVLEVQEVLRGPVGSGYIILRLVSGMDAPGIYVERVHEFEGEPGDTFVLFLTHGGYGWRGCYRPHQVGATGWRTGLQAHEESVHLMYRIRYGYERVPDRKRRAFDAQLSEARRVGQLIRANSSQ